MSKSFGTAISVVHMATPSASVPAGSAWIYPKSDGLWYTKNSAGVETLVGGGGGSGDVTTTTPQTITGVKTFPVGALLMRNAANTASNEPYSDSNPPFTLNMSDQVSAPANPPTGESTLYINGKVLKVRDTDGTEEQFAPLASPAFTGTPTGITKTHVGLANAENTTDLLKVVSTATQTALNLKANLASPTFTGTVGGITKAMVGLTSATDTSDANKPVSTAQQTALNLKANLASPAFTGTPTGITAAHVGAAAASHTHTKANITDLGTIGTAAALNVAASGNAASTEVVKGNDNRLVPPASVQMFAGPSAPTGWLMCDGAAVSRSTYSALWDVLRNGGSTSPFGNGDGSTTFNTPDYLRRAPIGVAPTLALGANDGEAVVANRSHSHGHTGDTGSTGSGHTHSIPAQAAGTTTTAATGGGTNVTNRASFDGHAHGGDTGAATSHTHNISSQAANPYMTINFIIKT